MKHSFQVILIRHRNDEEGAPFDEAVERALKGGSPTNAYLGTGEDLGVEFKKFDLGYQIPNNIENLLGSVHHTLVVAVIDYEGLKDEDLLNWLKNCWDFVRTSEGGHQLLLLALDERVGDKLRNLRPTLGTCQVITSQQLGEKAIRPAMISLRVLHEARVLLATAQPKTNSTQQQPGFLRLFISHAKIDGFPLALSLNHLIETIPWLKSFYDARDLQSEVDWENALRKTVTASMLVILRTDAYEQRPWCREEALLAEEYATPAILVEARPGLAYPPCDLSFERIPSVRIPDGNLFRILQAALREGLRYFLFQCKVDEMQNTGVLPNNCWLRKFSYPPNMPALLRACKDFQSGGHPSHPTPIIIYPDPPLRSGFFEAAEALVSRLIPDVRLVTPLTLATQLLP